MPSLKLQDILAQTISKDNWERAGFKKRAGILIPLFSVYSKDSFGIGDFFDLKLIIDWAKSTGNSIVQLLPMNEVGPLFCPYDSLSSFALEPAYISPREFSELKNKKFKQALKEKGFVDYSVKEEKLKLLWEVYLKKDLSGRADFEEFQLSNYYWLRDFALFKTLKNRHQGKPWYEWEDCFRSRDKSALDRFQQENIEEITFHMWVQWVAFNQFRQAAEYANKNNILLKGDLPVLVSRDSADVWSHPDYFKLDFAAGAPADMYAARGQRWGMPIYNWEKIASDNFRYIKEKLKYAEEFYNLLRIDHVVGLFRIWSIAYNEPQENLGLNGKFDPCEESLWYEHGQRILKVLIKNTKMLLCAEDLGTVPKSCTDTLLELGIAGNDVQRWVKDWSKRHDFLLPKEYRLLAVAMLSTHDTTNWKAWWQYEAGTVDEGLFLRKCRERGIDFEQVKVKLFDAKLSFHGRLRWKKEIDSVDKLLWELGKNKEEVADFIEIYQNTYAEKEKLWKILKCKGPVTEAASQELVSKIFEFVLSSNAVFCINSMLDYLMLADVFKGEPYQYRINVPGTISGKNWSMRLPLSLEQLLSLPLNKKIRKIITESGRI